jgi:hypothetical protein
LIEYNPRLFVFYDHFGSWHDLHGTYFEYASRAFDSE